MPSDTTDPWRGFVERHRLAREPGTAWTWAGDIDGVATRVEVRPIGPEERLARVVMTVASRVVILPRALALSDLGAVSSGDRDLDAVALVFPGDAGGAPALTANQCVRLTRLVADGVHLAAGELVLEPWARVSDVPETLASMLRLARSFAVASPVASPDDGMLATLWREATDLGAGSERRQRAFVKLLSMFSSAQLAPWLERLVDDDASALEVLADLAASGAAGRSLPLAVLALLVDNDHPEVHGPALEALVDVAGPVEAIVSALSRRGLARLLRVAPRLGAGHQTAALLDALYPRLGTLDLRGDPAVDGAWQGDEDRLWVLRARYLERLTALGHQPATRWAIAALGDGHADALQLAALALLARLGAPAALAEIRPLTGGLFRSSRIKDAARAAIAAIRERAGGDEGGLSLSAEGGGLTTPDAHDPRDR